MTAFFADDDECLSAKKLLFYLVQSLAVIVKNVNRIWEKSLNLRRSSHAHVCAVIMNKRFDFVIHSRYRFRRRSNGSGGGRRRSAGDEAALGLSLRTRTTSGHQLTDIEILEQVTVLNLDTGN